MKIKIFLIVMLSISVCILLPSCNLKPHEHSFGEWQTELEPTCTAPGSAVRECIECGFCEYEAIPLKEHDTSRTVIEPTCKSEGYTLLKCDCGYESITDVTDKLAHTFSHSTIEPTCEDDGYDLHVCQICDYSCKDSVVVATGHNFTQTSIYPTVLKAGSTTYTCHCSFSYTEDIPYSVILPNAYAGSDRIVAHGIDVSQWNHQKNGSDYLPLDWNAIKAAGIDFVILKAGSTKTPLEPTFQMDYEGARAAGLEVGAYFYTYSDSVEKIKADAELFLEALDGKTFEYPVFLDLEDPSIAELSKPLLSSMCAEFISVLQAQGYYAGLYVNHDWLFNILDTNNAIETYEIWYARFPGTTDPTWNEEKYGKHLGMWQYTDSGIINGIDSNFDMNYAYKSYKEIMIKWGFNGY